MFSVALVHGLGPGLWGEDSFVTVALQLGKEEVVELIRLNLLERDQVGTLRTKNQKIRQILQQLKSLVLKTRTRSAGLRPGFPSSCTPS